MTEDGHDVELESRLFFFVTDAAGNQGILTEGEGSVRTVDLLIRGACFVKAGKKYF